MNGNKLVTELWYENQLVMEVEGGIPSADMRKLHKRSGYLLITRGARKGMSK